MLIDRGMDIYKLNVKCSSAVKKYEIIPFAATRMNLEVIILSEVSQKEKHKYNMIPLIHRI